MLSRITLSPNNASSLLREHRAWNLWGMGVERVFKGPAPHGERWPGEEPVLTELLVSPCRITGLEKA